MKEVPQFPQSQFLTPKLGKGYNGVVYGLSADYAAKVPVHMLELGSNSRQMQVLNNPNSAVGMHLADEYNIATELYAVEISVPKPEGIYGVKIRWIETAFGLFFPEKLAFVMERVNGIDAKKTRGDLRKKVEQLHQQELRKCNERGFYSGAHLSLNGAMYDLDGDRIVFVDVGHFARK